MQYGPTNNYNKRDNTRIYETPSTELRTSSSSHCLYSVCCGSRCSGERVASSSCVFPRQWRGRYFQSGLGDVFVRDRAITTKGHCIEHNRDYFLFHNRSAYDFVPRYDLYDNQDDRVREVKFLLSGLGYVSFVQNYALLRQWLDVGLYRHSGQTLISRSPTVPM